MELGGRDRRAIRTAPTSSRNRRAGRTDAANGEHGLYNLVDGPYERVNSISAVGRTRASRNFDVGSTSYGNSTAPYTSTHGFADSGVPGASAEFDIYVENPVDVR